MSGAVHSTGNFAELLWPGIAKIWGTKYKYHETKYTKFFELRTSDKQFEKSQQVTSFPLAGVKEEGNEAFFSQMFQGFQQEYRHLTYSIGAIVTREMSEDDQYGVIKQIPKMLAESMRQVEETVATNLLNNGFNSAFPFADGQAMFSTAHPLAGTGGTASNTLSTAADLSQTSFEQGLIDVLNFVDDQEKKLTYGVKKLVVPNQLIWKAQKLLETKFVTGSADNDINPIANLGIELITSSFITDIDSWYLITDCDNGLTFYTRREAELDRDNDFETDNLKMKSTKRFSAGMDDFRGVYGSPGA